MKVSFDHKKLKSALTALCGVVPKQPRNPILLHLRMDIISDKEALLYTTDETIFLYKKVPLESCDSKGSLTIDAKNFLELIKNFKKGPKINISMVNDTRIRVTQEKSRYHFNSLNPFSYPTIDMPKKELFHDLATESFLTALKKVEHAIGGDHSNEILRNVYIEPTKEEGFIRAVASDGVQLITCKVPGVISNTLLLPKNPASLLIKVLANSKECGLYTDDSKLYVTHEDGLFCSRLSSHKYPNYSTLFSKGESVHVVLDLPEVCESLKRALLFSEKINMIIYPEGNLIIRPIGQNDDSQDEIKLKSPVEKLSKPLQLGLNAIVLSQLLSKFEGEEVSLNVYGAKNPLLFQGSPSMVGLFMPLGGPM